LQRAQTTGGSWPAGRGEIDLRMIDPPRKDWSRARDVDASPGPYYKVTLKRVTTGEKLGERHDGTPGSGGGRQAKQGTGDARNGTRRTHQQGSKPGSGDSGARGRSRSKGRGHQASGRTSKRQRATCQEGHGRRDGGESGTRQRDQQKTMKWTYVHYTMKRLRINEKEIKNGKESRQGRNAGRQLQTGRRQLRGGARRRQRELRRAGSNTRGQRSGGAGTQTGRAKDERKHQHPQQPR
jgi:hypothetical protein